MLGLEIEDAADVAKGDSSTKSRSIWLIRSKMCFWGNRSGGRPTRALINSRPPLIYEVFTTLKSFYPRDLCEAFQSIYNATGDTSRGVRHIAFWSFDVLYASSVRPRLFRPRWMRRSFPPFYNLWPGTWDIHFASPICPFHVSMFLFICRVFFFRLISVRGGRTGE